MKRSILPKGHQLHRQTGPNLHLNLVPLLIWTAVFGASRLFWAEKDVCF